MKSRALRRAAVVLAILLLVALAAMLTLALAGEWRLRRATERFEAVLGSPEPARPVRAVEEPTDNAATWLLAGAGAVVMSGEQRALTAPRGGDEREWTAEEWQRAEGIVEQNSPALELLRRAAGCAASSYSLDYSKGPETELPPLDELLRAGTTLWLDARLAIRAGDLGRLRADLATLDRLAGSLAAEPMVVTVLIALAADRTYLDLTHRVVTAGGGNEALLAELEATLAARDRPADLRRALAFEGSQITLLERRLLLEHRVSGPLQWLGEQLARPFIGHFIAGLIDEYTAVGELASRSWPEIVAESEARYERGFPRSFAVTLYPNLISTVERLLTGESTRRLALEAIRQRRAALAGGGYPGPREPPLIDPYTGRGIVVERRPEGALHLEAPGALELWRSHNSAPTRLGEPPFAWQLPAAP